MAILNAEDEAHSSSPTARRCPHRSGLFVRTLVPKGAVSRSISCSMVPPHAMTRRTRGSPASLRSCRQVVISRDTSIQVLAVDDETLSLRPLVDLMLFTRIYDIAAISSPVPGRDVLVVLNESSKVSFMQFDDHTSRLRCSGEVNLSSVTCTHLDNPLRSQARLLATHPTKRMVAVAGLQSFISVFPVLFLPKQVNAGKIATVAVNGVILSLDFLEDEEGVPGDAILLALLQRGKEQVIDLYTVGVPPDSGGGLSVTFVGSMITCASHPDDVAVARATYKLTGETVRPTPPAVAVTRLAGCPYLFAVFVNGKVIAGDARSVIVNAHCGGSLPMSVRIEDNIVIPNHASNQRDQIAAINQRHSTNASAVSNDGRSLFVDRIAQGQDVPHQQDDHGQISGLPLAAASTANREGIMRLQELREYEVHSSLDSAEEGNEEQDNEQMQNVSDNSTTGLYRFPGVRALRSGEEDARSPQLASSRSGTILKTPFKMRPGSRNMGEDYLSYLFIPAYITLDVGDSNGVATTWVDAKDHFRDEAGDGSGLYFVMESGAMFALKWSDQAQKGSIRIPGGERTRTAPKRNFSVVFIGDVGPAVSIASLDRQLLYIANDGADGSLRRLHTPSSNHAMSEIPHASRQGFKQTSNIDIRRYGLEVRQEFPNLSPISDLAVIPPSGRPNRQRGENSQVLLSLQGEEIEDKPSQSTSVHKRNTSRTLPFCSEQLYLTSVAGDHLLVDGITQERTPRKNKLPSKLPTTAWEEQSAFEHVMFGGNMEAELVVCSGIGRHGSLRLIRPGSPVSLFASSASVFTACNNIWPFRFTRDSQHDAGLILTFAESTGVLYTMPIDDAEQYRRKRMSPMIARLVDGTKSLGFHSICRTIACGLIADGVLIQVHEKGIRGVILKKAGDVSVNISPNDQSVTESVFENQFDWIPPEGGFISVGAVGAGFVVVCSVPRGPKQPVLYLLSMHPSDPNLGLFIVSSVELDQELSCISIPEWTLAEAELDLMSRFPPIVVLGTYAPSMEVRILGPALELIDVQRVTPWTLARTGRSINEASVTTPGLSDGNPEIESSPLGKRVPKSQRRDTCEMTAVPESICGLEMDGRRLVFAGLRDGSVLGFSFSEMGGPDQHDARSPCSTGHLRLDFHRKLGYIPVMLESATVALGKVVIGQAERSWMCVGIGGGKMKWTPLAFTETRALCPISVLGAERCLAIVAVDDALHICGIRQQYETSVRSIHVGVTPRRVLVVDSPKDSIVVATCREPGFMERTPSRNRRTSKAQTIDDTTAAKVHSELRVYDRKSRSMSGHTSLHPGELVHILLNWLSFIVVGTSCDIRDSNDSVSHNPCKRGRLLLYSLCSHGGSKPSSSQESRTKFALCSEVVFPGAVLAGAVHPEAEILVVSCNEEVLVFGVSKSHSVLMEIARTSARAVVVSVSIHQDIICVVDRKDSVGFFQLQSNPVELIRDRGDHRRRIVSEAAMLNRTVAMAVDRFGCIFSVGYEEGDAPAHANITLRGGSLTSSFLRSNNSSVQHLGLTAEVETGEVSTAVGLGEEFDVMLQESGSEHTNGSNDQILDDSGESSIVEAVDEVADSDQGADAEGGDGEGAGEHANSASAESETVQGDANDVGTDVADGTLTTEEVIMTDGHEAGTIEGADNAGLNTGSAQVGNRVLRADHDSVPRNLACHHTFNMNDTSLCVRVGHFGHNENLEGSECNDLLNIIEKSSDKRDGNSPVVFCGTLGGAIITAVTVPPQVFSILSEVEGYVSQHCDIAGPALGHSHKRFRAAYGFEAVGTVDGDLLSQFSCLDYGSKLSIAGQAGCAGEEGVLHIEGLIATVFDRVS